MPWKDPEVGRAKKREYYQRNRERLIAAARARDDANPERAKARVRKWCEENQERRRAIVAASDAKHREKRNEKTNRWRRENPDKRRAIERRYAERYPEAIRRKHSRRRAAERQAVPPWFGELDYFVTTEAAHLAVLREQATGIPWHVDHIVPLRGKTVSGLHTWNNLQVITAAENVRKRNRFDPEKVNTLPHLC